MAILLIDAETYSECDLKAAGSYKYMQHPSTVATLWSVRAMEWDSSLVFENSSLWDVLRSLKAAKRVHWTRNEPLQLVSWGAFDRMLVQYRDTNIPEDAEWKDSSPGLAGIEGPLNTLWCDLREISLSYGGPGNLKNGAKFFGDGIEAKAEGKDLIRLFCMPQKDGHRVMPEDDQVRWEEFRAYARLDTATMVPIMRRFMGLQYGHSHVEHFPHLRVIGRMNERGVPADTESAETAISKMAELEDALVAEIDENYGFRPSQVAKVKEFLGLENTQRETLENFLLTATDPDHIRVANARLATAGAARKKLGPIVSMAQDDLRIRGCYDYHGAWTRRLTSFGVQLQNMVRKPCDEGFFEGLAEREWDTEIFEAVRTNIRGFLKAPPGNILVAADYSQIELRVGAWLAGEEWLLQAFRDGVDPYRLMASDLYRIEPDDVSDAQRQFGKVVELGSMYQLGHRGLAKQAAGYGIDLNEGDARHAIDVYRDKHPAIVLAWGGMQDAFRTATVGGLGSSINVDDVTFQSGDNFTKVIRPSGFAQYYWLARIGVGHWPDGNEREELEYARRDRSGKMVPDTTYGGDIFQGIVQGTAADIMLHGMHAAEVAGYPPIMSIHDEIVAEIEDDGKDHVGDLCKIINSLPEWAEGIPMEASGWQSTRFTKD